MASTDTPFSVLIPIYQGVVPDEVDMALESCFEQTILPDEVLLVEEGELPAGLESTLAAWTDRYDDVVRRHSIPADSGLGVALKVGVEECRYDLIARFDADDVNLRKRFETQLNYLEHHPDVDVLGSVVEEFSDDPQNPVAVRSVPGEHDEITQMARFRNPMNHMSVMFRREAVRDAGNYRAVQPFEDYDLWVRMLCAGATFANVLSALVRARTGDALSERRGGFDYARSEIQQQINFHRQGFISLPIMLFNILTRGGIRLLPDRLRANIYSRFARAKE
ncbi:glycosyltransferase [Haloarcula argentinensis]|uniref:Glycosyltransferase n=1 Tax=Haloarcula argentinensis TaxID=43776 RepID=A0A847U884_HALAR|nr:glycosyltransferase [Haloarcula argentinensis]NLV11953.1 glycosyltransferase [Haloarcula argentinensis]